MSRSVWAGDVAPRTCPECGEPVDIIDGSRGVRFNCQRYWDAKKKHLTPGDCIPDMPVNYPKRGDDVRGARDARKKDDLRREMSPGELHGSTGAKGATQGTSEGGGDDDVEDRERGDRGDAQTEDASELRQMSLL